MARELTEDGPGRVSAAGPGRGHHRRRRQVQHPGRRAGVVDRGGLSRARDLDAARAVVLRLFERAAGHRADPRARHWTGRPACRSSPPTRGMGVPRYEVSSDGPDHDRRFTAVVYVGGRPTATAGDAPRRPPRPTPPRRPGPLWTPNGTPSRSPNRTAERARTPRGRGGAPRPAGAPCRAHHHRGVGAPPARGAPAPGGAADLTARLRGARIAGTDRRGKYLWLVLDEGETALVVHLGMSGQMLLGPDAEPRTPAHRRGTRRRHRAELRRPAHLRRLATGRPGDRRRQPRSRCRWPTSPATRSTPASTVTPW